MSAYFLRFFKARTVLRAPILVEKLWVAVEARSRHLVLYRRADVMQGASQPDAGEPLAAAHASAPVTPRADADGRALQVDPATGLVDPKSVAARDRVRCDRPDRLFDA